MFKKNNIQKPLTGPTEASMDDFWRMIWEHNTATIVMLTSLLENGKVGKENISAMIVTNCISICSSNVIVTGHYVTAAMTLYVINFFISLTPVNRYNMECM